MFKLGTKAPDFNLSDKDGLEYQLKDFKEDFLIIYFYPKDNTPGCTIEAKDFTEKLKDFQKLGAKIIGISGGDAKSKASFCKKQKLKVLLLSDTHFKVARKYKAFGTKTFMGRKYKGILRNTYVINKARKVARIFEQVKAEGHVDEVLEYIRSDSKPPKKASSPSSGRA